MRNDNNFLVLCFSSPYPTQSFLNFLEKMFKRRSFLLEIVFITIFFFSCSKVPELDRDKTEEANSLNQFGMELAKRFSLYKEAIVFLKRSSEMAPSNYEFLRNLGLAYFNLGKYDEALSYFEKAALLFEHDKSIYHYLGLIYFEKAEYEKSFENFEKMIAIYESNKKKYTYSDEEAKQQSVFISLSWALSGLAADQMGNGEKAIEYSEKAMNEYEKLGDNINFKEANNKVNEFVNKYQR